MAESKTNYPGIRRHGRGIQIDYRDDHGRRKRFTMRIPATASNMRKANDLRGNIHTDIAFDRYNEKRYFPNSKRAKNTNVPKTVAELLHLYMQSGPAGLSKRTQKVYRDDIENKLIPGIGSLSIRHLSVTDIEPWRNTLTVAPKTINNIVIPLRNAFKYAVRHKILDTNPLALLRDVKVQRKEANPLLPAEVDAVLNIMSDVGKEYYQVAIWTGLSTNEQIGLWWEDIDFEQRKIHIRRGVTRGEIIETKNNTRWRDIDLLPPAYDVLLGMKAVSYDPAKPVFVNPNTGHYWGYSALTKQWNKALAALNIKHRRPYTTRHTFASLMLSAGAPIGWLKYQMGHANLEMLSTIYARWISDNAVQSVADWVKERCGVHGELTWPPKSDKP